MAEGIDRLRIAVLLPCFNEAAAIVQTVAAVRQLPMITLRPDGPMAARVIGIRSSTGCAEAGVRANGVGCSTGS